MEIKNKPTTIEAYRSVRTGLEKVVMLTRVLAFKEKGGIDEGMAFLLAMVAVTVIVGSIAYMDISSDNRSMAEPKANISVLNTTPTTTPIPIVP